MRGSCMQQVWGSALTHEEAANAMVQETSAKSADIVLDVRHASVEYAGGGGAGGGCGGGGGAVLSTAGGGRRRAGSSSAAGGRAGTGAGSIARLSLAPALHGVPERHERAQPGLRYWHTDYRRLAGALSFDEPEEPPGACGGAAAARGHRARSLAQLSARTLRWHAPAGHDCHPAAAEPTDHPPA